MKPISVVIPCFNLGEFLPEAVQSVRCQTAPAAELIIVDDGSTDDMTQRVLAKYSAEGVTVYRTENQGAPAARNFGIARASGDYILCLDADDILLPAYLDEVSRALSGHPELGIVTPHVEFFGDRSGVWRTKDYNPSELLRENCISSASMFRKVCWKQVGGYHDLPAFQDWDFWISIMEAGWKWAVVPKPLYRYRVRPNSVSAYGRANRGLLLRTIVQRHLKSYQTHVEDIFVTADSELRTARARNDEHARDKALASQSIGTAFTLASGGAMELAERRAALQECLASADSRCDALRKELTRLDSLEHISLFVREHVPETSAMLVVSHGDDELLRQLGRRAQHFPQGADGRYAGYHPANSMEAIAHLEFLRSRGSQYILFPGSSGWWLDYYRELAVHLESHYDVVARREDGTVLYSLAP